MRQLDFFRQLLGIPRSAPPPVAAKPAPVPDKPDSADELRWKAIHRLTELGATDLAMKVRVAWNPRMRTTAGLAYPRQHLIVLNPRLHEFGSEEIERTLLHELAHLLAHHRAGRRRIAPHGPEWQQACRDLGLPDEKRCHDLPLPRRRMAARHFYRCPSCATELRRVRPLRGKCACLACCRKHNGGRYHDRFRFVRIAAPSSETQKDTA